jgi:hypothetical protein
MEAVIGFSQDLGAVPLGIVAEFVSGFGDVSGAISAIPLTSANLFLEMGALPFQALQAAFEAMTGSGAALWESATILLTPLDLIGASIANLTTII